MKSLTKTLALVMMAAALAGTLTVHAKKVGPATAATRSELPTKVGLAAMPREKHESEVRLDSGAGLTGFPSLLHFQVRERLTGTVKWFNPQKGFGYISRDDQRREVFVHSTAIQIPPGASDTFRNLAEGQRVQFEIESGPKGPRAVNIMKI